MQRTDESTRAPYVSADATLEIRLEELRDPNEFDLKLLQHEGRHFEGVTIRGARVLRPVFSDGYPMTPSRREVSASRIRKLLSHHMLPAVLATGLTTMVIALTVAIALL
jgi:hypothetical protein